MKTKMIVILIAMLSMLMVCSAETGMIEIEETFDGSVVDVTVNYDATVEDYWGAIKYKGIYDINGTITIDGKTYNADFDGTGGIYIKEEKVIRLSLHVDGKIYQNSEVGFLYKENDIDYYGYIENGYNTSGDIYFCKNTGSSQGGDVLFFNGFTLDGYSKYVITHEEVNESSLALGIGNGNNVMGDIIPTMFAYKDPETGKRVVSETYPTDHDGPVIRTPAHIVGEPLFPKDFWTTPRGIGILEGKEHRK